MPAEDKEHSSQSKLGEALEQIKGVLTLSALLILALIIGGSFIGNQSAQILTGILTTFITTLVSIFATYHSSVVSSTRTAKDELTRYGLLAWRNLDSLQLKVNQQLQQSAPATGDTLRGWLLDIDQAKWAWQDILREVFDLQERLQAETYELAREYKEKIQAAAPEDRSKLEVEKQAQFARLASSSPLPLRVPGDVKCPNCNNPVTVLIGQNTGDTATLRCPDCRRTFHAHRAADGSLFSRRWGGGSPQAHASAQVQVPETKVGIAVSLCDIRLQALRAVSDVFVEASGETLRGGWEEFFGKVSDRLAAEGLGPEATRAIQKWLFSLKAFRLLGPGNGIGLVPAASSLVDYVEERETSSLLAVDPSLTPEEILQRLYGSNTERLACIQRIVACRRPPPTA